MSGRTVWWAKDAGWWRRERIVELCEEFGTDGAAVIDWLTCEAKAQGRTGEVKAGYRAITRGAFLSPDVPVRPIVSRSVQLGLLDDFEENDRTFTCRISGWAEEQARAGEAVKKRGQRSRSSGEQADLQGNPEGDETGQNGTRPPLSPVVPECPPTGQDRTGQEKTSSSLVPAHPEGDRLCRLLAELIVERDPKAKVAPESKEWRDSMRLLIDRDGRTPAEVERIIRWAQANSFWQPNVLSAGKLRKQFTTLVAQEGRETSGGLAVVPRSGSPRDTADADVARYLADAERLKAEEAERRSA